MRAHEDHARNNQYKFKGPAPNKGIKKESRRPKAAVSKPYGSAHDPTTYKPKAPSAQEQVPKSLGVIKKKAGGRRPL